MFCRCRVPSSVSPPKHLWGTLEENAISHSNLVQNSKQAHMESLRCGKMLFRISGTCRGGRPHLKQRLSLQPGLRQISGLVLGSESCSWFRWLLLWGFREVTGPFRSKCEGGLSLVLLHLSLVLAGNSDKVWKCGITLAPFLPPPFKQRPAETKYVSYALFFSF